jgi:hypothetical protein
MSYARTAFVFAGGSSLGAIQVDMLRELMHTTGQHRFCRAQS